MSLLSSVQCFVGMAFLYTSFYYQVADGNKTTPLGPDIVGPTADNCACYYQGKIYNLAPLERDDGKPRFPTVPGSGQWVYSYNPCREFSLGPPTKSDCYGDVAICMSTSNNASYQNIGRHRTVSCGFNKETLTPQLIYTNKERFPNGKAIVDFKCDPSKKTADEAKFYVIDDSRDPRKFLIASICACPDGCPNDPEDPGPPDGGINKLENYLLIGGLSFVVIVVPLIIYIKRKYYCQCIRRQNDHNEEQQPIVNPVYDRVDYAAGEERRPGNPQNVPQPSPAGPSSGSNINRATEHNFNTGVLV